MIWWGWWRRRGEDARARAEQAEAELRRVQNLTPRYEALANELRLPDEEFTARLADAFRLRRRPS